MNLIICGLYLYPILFTLFLGTAQASETVLDIEQFLRLVEEQNYDLKIEQFKNKSSEYNAVGLSLPPPMLAVSKQTEGAQGEQEVDGVEISQEIPFPSKIYNDYQERKMVSKAANENYINSKNEIISQAKIAYFQLWVTQERYRLLKAKQQIIKDHIRLTRSTTRSDSFSGIYLLNAETDLDLLENEILKEEQNLKQKKEALKIFLGPDSIALDVEVMPPTMSQLPVISDLESSPQLRSKEYLLKSYEYKEKLADSSWFPDFNLRLKQMSSESMSSPTQEIMIGITLPFLFPWQPYKESSIVGAEKRIQQFEYEREKRNLNLNFSVKMNQAKSIKTQIENLTQKVMPKLSKRLAMIQNIVPRDMESLQVRREVLESEIDLKLNIFELRLEFEEIVSELEKYKNKADNDRKNI